MATKPGDSIKIRRTLHNISGQVSDADSLPTAKLLVNGEDTSIVVTVTHKDTGEYNLETLLPTHWEQGDEVEIIWTATVGGITGKATAWSVVLGSKSAANEDVEWAETVSTYSSIIDADEYLSSRMYTQAWDEASSNDKLKALVHATELIDTLNFYGDKAEEDQILEFPRNDESEIPVNIRKACCLIALALLDDVNPEKEFENLVLTSGGFGPAKITKDTTITPEHIANGIPAIQAWYLIKPFLRNNRSITLSRVS